MTNEEREVIAGALKSARRLCVESGELESLAGVHYSAHAIADALSATDPQFDHGRFLASCGVAP